VAFDSRCYVSSEAACLACHCTARSPRTASAGMTRSSTEVKCTVNNGTLCMHLDDVRVHIPSHIVNESKVLLDALSSVRDSLVTSDFTLAAPVEWLQAWVCCFVGESEPLGSAEIEVLVKCLKVCSWQFHDSLLPSHAVIVFKSYHICTIPNARIAMLSYKTATFWCHSVPSRRFFV
jgi:hypothetical protein